MPEPPRLPTDLSVYLPQLSLILPVKCHPAVSELTEGSEQWIRENLLVGYPAEQDELLEQASALFGCLCYPTAKTAQARTICDFMAWLFAQDFFLNHDPEAAGGSESAAISIFSDFMGILRGDRSAIPQNNMGTYEVSLSEVWGRIDNLAAGKAQRERLIESVHSYLRGAATEVGKRVQDEVFTLEEYMKVRRESVGGIMCLRFAEFGTGFDLSEQFAASSHLDELTRIANEHFIFCNDLFSFRFEYYKGDYMNAVIVLMSDKGRSAQEAVYEVCDAVEAREREFVYKREQVLSSALASDPGVRAYIDAVSYFLAGNTRWSYVTPRYHGRGYIWNGLTAAKLTLKPQRTVFSSPGGTWSEAACLLQRPGFRGILRAE